LAAFLFLLLTKFSETYTQSIEFTIQLSELDDEVVIKQDSSNTVEAIVRAKGFNLLPYLLNTGNTFSINAKDYTSKKDNTLVMDVRANRHLIANQLSNDMDILSIKPDTLFFNFDVMASKTVPVQLNANVSYVSGFDVVDRLKLSQDSVKLIGSNSKLDTIKVVNTKPLQLKAVQNTIDEVLQLEALDTDITVLPKTLSVSGTVKRFTEGKVTLPIALVNVPLGKELNYFPKTADLIYYVDLERFNDVKAQDFKIIADFNSLKHPNQKRIELKIAETSPIVKSTRLNQNSIEFIILE